MMLATYWIVIVGVGAVLLVAVDRERKRMPNKQDEVLKSAPDLHRAIASGRLKRAGRLLDEGASVQEPDGDANTALHWARSRAAVDLLVARGANIEARNQDGETPLFTVGHPRALEALAAHGANFAVVDRTKETPLHDAQDVACAQFFVSQGIPLDAIDLRGNTPLHLVRRPDIAEFLLGAGADLHAHNVKGDEPIHVAKDPEMIEFFVGAGCGVGRLNKAGLTPLMRSRNGECAKTLVGLGADIDQSDPDGMTALMHAAAAGRKPFVLVLLELGADLARADHAGHTALGHAAAAGSADCVELLLNAGADLRMQAISLGWELPMIEYLMRNGGALDPETLHLADPERIDYAIEAGVDIDHTDERGRTALMKSIRWDALKHLLDCGADATIVSHGGQTALDTFPWPTTSGVSGAMYSHHAAPDLARRLLGHCSESSDLDALAEHVDVEHALVLIEYGAAIAGDRHLRQALSKRASLQVVETLLSAGATLGPDRPGVAGFDLTQVRPEVLERLLRDGAKFDFSGSHRDVLIRCHDARMARLLIEAGASVEVDEGNGYRPIHRWWRQPGMLKVLLEAGADPNAKSGDGQTVLHLIVRMGHPGKPADPFQQGLVQMLVDAGADPTIRDRGGMSARDYVYRAGFDVLLKSGTATSAAR